MKIKNIMIMLLFVSTIFVGCDDVKEVGDFSNPSAPYVEFAVNTATAVAAKQGQATPNIGVRMREAQNEPVVVTYQVSGAYTANGTVTIPRQTLSANIVLNIPANVIVAPATSANATITLTGAKAGTRDLTVGYAATKWISRPINITN